MGMSRPVARSAKDAPSKEEEISLVLSEPDVDLWRLRELALSEGGLINDTLRKRAWPKLVGLHSRDDPHNYAEPRSATLNAEFSGVKYDSPVEGQHKHSKKLVSCLDAEQIERDIARCTWHLLTGSQRSRRLQMKNKHRKRVATLLRRKQRRLGNLINLVLVRSYGLATSDEDRLRYYQGYHDVGSVLISALGGAADPLAGISSGLATPVDQEASSLGLDLPSKVLLQISTSHLRDAMRPNFEQLSSALRIIILPLIGALDPELHSHLYYCQMEPFFALSWIITWFSHDVRDTEMVKRLFDVFIVSHPLMVIYMSVAMILHPVNRIEILETDCDFASVHNALAGLPRNSSNVGWKTVGDGYMSAEEDDGDGASSMGQSDGWDREDYRDDEESEAPSFASTPVWNPGHGARVPFQDIIDMAISIM